MVDSKFRFFKGKSCKIWLKDGFFRQGTVLEVSKDDSIILDDRKDGITYLSDDMIKHIKEIKNGC